MFNTNKKIILIIILILGVFVMPNNFIKNIIENANGQIKYKETYVTGEITVDNGDGTYDVKINNASDAYKNVETRDYDAIFSVGEIVDIGYEYGTKESPKILGHSKKIKQEPKQVEVDYSGGCADGIQTKTIKIYIGNASGFISGTDNNYSKCHDSIDGSDLSDRGLYTDNIVVGQYNPSGDYNYAIVRGYLYFDTLNIPTNAIISSAILTLMIAGNFGIDFNIVVQDGQPTYPHSTLEYSDYNYTKYKNNGGSVGATTPGYVNIPFNSNGKNWINKGGLTKFCLRSSKDISGDAPSETNSILIDKETYPSYLTITYTI